MGRTMAMSPSGDAKARHELGRGAIVAVEIAAGTGGEQADGLALVTRLQVFEALGQLAFERLEPADLCAGRSELLRVNLAHLRHRVRSGRRRLPLADHA